MPAIQCDRSRGGDQGELIGLSVAHFEIMRAAPFSPRWNIDGDDEIAALEDVVPLRLGAG